MSTTTQVWNTYERIVSETINESKLSLEEEDGQDYGEVLKELRRAWELKLIQSGALALGTEVDPNLQKAGASGSKLGIKLEDGVVPVKKEEETEAKAEATVAREENQSQSQNQNQNQKKTKRDEEEKDGDEEGAKSEERPAKRMKPTSSQDPAPAPAPSSAEEREKDASHGNGNDNGGGSGSGSGSGIGAAASDPLAGIEIDDDIDDDIDDLLGEQEDPADLVLAKVDKKFKSKNKYRFHFRSGILKVNGREFVFEKGKGDFNW